MSNNTTYVVISNNQIAVPSASSISEWIAPYGAELAAEQIDQVQHYIGLLLFWNQKISLTSIDDPEEIVSRHFGESFFCAKFIPTVPSRLADVGSGAGFPGLALRILRPEIEVFLIEQDTRKAAFLNEAARLLKLELVKVYRTHYETMNPEFANLNTVTARGVGNHRTILKWAAPRLSDHGQMLFLVGLEDAMRIMQLKSWHWDQPRLLPQSKKRVILIGTPSK